MNEWIMFVINVCMLEDKIASEDKKTMLIDVHWRVKKNINHLYYYIIK